VVLVVDRLSRSPDELLTGWRAADVRGMLIIGGEDVEWTSGSIHLLGQGSRLTVGASAELLVGFGIAWVTGQGRVVNNGTMTAVEGGVLRIDTVLNTPGTIAAEGGEVTLKGDIVQVTGARVLEGGTWRAGPGGTIWFDEASIVRNSASIIVRGDGSLSRLRTLTRNTGHITLSNAGGWIASGAQANLVNKGTITKDGGGVRTIAGTITQKPRGTIDVRSGTLTLDTPLFRNTGEVVLSNASHNLPAARFRITGDFEQTDGGLLSYTGRVEDEGSFPRLIAREFRLDGSLTVNFSGHVPGNIGPVLGFGQRPRIGTFSDVGVNIQQGVGLLQYTPRGWQVLITG
jgi:hypothetical protein